MCTIDSAPPPHPHPTPRLLAASSTACRGCGHIEHSLSPLVRLSTALTIGTPALTGVCTPHNAAFVYSLVSVHHTTQASCTLWCLYTTQHSLRVLSGVCTPLNAAFVYWCLYTTQHTAFVYSLVSVHHSTYSLRVLTGVCTPLNTALVYWWLYTTQHTAFV